MNRINEIGDTPKGQYMLGRVASRANNRASAANLGTKERRKQRVKSFDATHKAESNRLAYNKGDFHKGWDDENNKNESKNMNKKLIRLTESDLHRIVKESVNRVIKEGVEFSSEDPQEEWMYYQNKLQQEFDELGVMILNKIPRNDPDRQIIQRYIRMIQTHLHSLEN